MCAHTHMLESERERERKGERECVRACARMCFLCMRLCACARRGVRGGGTKGPDTAETDKAETDKAETDKAGGKTDTQGSKECQRSCASKQGQREMNAWQGQ